MKPGFEAMMKHTRKYNRTMKSRMSVTALWLLMAAGTLSGCSQSPIDTAEAGGSGSVALRIAATRAESDGNGSATAYNPLDYQTIRIYNASDELIRRYTGTTLPARLELLAGNYSVGVEVGEQAAASFDKRYYVGRKPFTVTAGQSAEVEVTCARQNVAAEVSFDPSVAERLGATAKVWVAAASTEQTAELGKGSLDELLFTEAGKGYFMLPEGVTTLIYRFEGTLTNPTPGSDAAVTGEGSLPGVSAGANCQLTFRYSDDAPGHIECFGVQVDDSAEEHTDDIIWTDISISGDGFDVEAQQEYIPGKSAGVTYLISNLTPIDQVELYAGSQSYDLIGSTYDAISVTKKNDREMSLTLGDAFFTALGGGDQEIRIRVRDTSNGELSRTTPFRVQGLLPVTAADCDLWANRVTLRALVLDPAAGEVTFRLGEHTKAGTAAGDGTYTATFEPEWVETANAENPSYPSYYLPTAGTGVFAGQEYAYGLTIGSVTASGSFTTAGGDAIPGGDMEGGLSCFGTSNQNTTTWGSGNNTFASSLCNAATFNGMGGSQCAKLTAGEPLSGALGAGNLFTGTFTFNGIFDQSGTVGFGQKYNYTARPRSLKFKYHATVGTVNANKWQTILPQGSQDITTVYVAIVDWSARHNVTSGTGSAPTGPWDPSAQRTLDGSGAIIAYGIFDINATTPGDAMIEGEIPLRYYDTAAAAPQGSYTLVIACSTSKYGDYMNGCTTNVLYVDDFAWSY